MNLRNILHKFMYNARADVYRARLSKVGRTDDYVSEFELVYSDIPCKLSQYGKQLSAHRDDVSQKLTTDLRLTFDPEYQILPNDVIQIRQEGQEFKLFAGEQFSYETHAELSVRRRREAGQS